LYFVGVGLLIPQVCHHLAAWRWAGGLCNKAVLHATYYSKQAGTPRSKDSDEISKPSHRVASKKHLNMGVNPEKTT
jgi:hypothetical protein